MAILRNFTLGAWLGFCSGSLSQVIATLIVFRWGSVDENCQVWAFHLPQKEYFDLCRAVSVLLGCGGGLLSALAGFRTNSRVTRRFLPLGVVILLFSLAASAYRFKLTFGTNDVRLESLVFGTTILRPDNDIPQPKRGVINGG
jgi:hypothetical protein